MLKRLTIITLASIFLFGCQTPKARSEADADKIARLVGDFIISHQQLPHDISTLRAYEKGDYRVRWNSFTKVSFRPISANGVRIDFLDAAGASDYRIIYIMPTGLAPLSTPSTSLETNELTRLLADPKVMWIFGYIGNK